jgi:hypothetical protein
MSPTPGQEERRATQVYMLVTPGRFEQAGHRYPPHLVHIPRLLLQLDVVKPGVIGQRVLGNLLLILEPKHQTSIGNIYS